MIRSIIIFLINLETDTDRLLRMGREFKRIGLAYERISAIHGKQMPEYLKPYFFDREGSVVGNLKQGEVGCYASHLHIHHEILRRRLDWALVLEDDLYISDELPVIIDHILKLPRDWDIIRLSNEAKKSFVKVGKLTDTHTLVKYSRIPNNTGAYLISAEGAAKFIQLNEPRRFPLDVDLRRGWQFGLRTFGVLPAPVHSNIGESRIDRIEHRELGRQNYWYKSFSRICSGRTEFGFAAIRRIKYSISFLGWKSWLFCTASDLRAGILKRLQSKKGLTNRIR